jgi:hypothetical protein
MAYFLLYKYDRKENQKLRKLPFSTDAEAVIYACAVIADESGWDFEIQDDRGDAILSDDEIRDRCKQTGMP